jgi:hypothetical protein
MSEVQVEQEVSVDQETAQVDPSTKESNKGEYIAESKKYRHRSQASEAREAEKDKRISELEETLRLQETKKLEEDEEYKSLYESKKVEVEELKPIVENFQMQDKQRREYLLNQLNEDDQEIYQDLSTIKLEAHISKLKKNTIQVESGKEVTSSGKWASASQFKDLTNEDQVRMKKEPKLWKQFVEGYKK